MSSADAFAATLPPYARTLGIAVDHFEAGVPVLGCDPDLRVEGREDFWHGGALSGLLEMAAFAAIRTQLGGDAARLKPVNVTVQFLRGGLMQRTFAAGRVVRMGRRLVNVTAEAWQEDRQRLVATAQLQIVIAGQG